MSAPEVRSSEAIARRTYSLSPYSLREPITRPELQGRDVSRGPPPAGGLNKKSRGKRNSASPRLFL